MRTPESAYLPSGRSSPMQRPISGRSSPAQQLRQPPAKFGRSFPGSWAEVTEENDGREHFRDRECREDEDDELFDPAIFEGEWNDGWHNITVAREENGERKRGRNRIQFIARMHRPSKPDKTFRISQGRRGHSRHAWSCGNGQLISSESCYEGLVWATEDGRESEWTRVFEEDPHLEAMPITTPAGCFGNDPVWRPQPQMFWVATAVPAAVAAASENAEPTDTKKRAEDVASASDSGLNVGALEFVPSSKSHGDERKGGNISTQQSIDGLSKLNMAAVSMQAPVERMAGGRITPNRSPRESFSIGSPATQPTASPLIHPLRAPLVPSPAMRHIGVPRSPAQLLRVRPSPTMRPRRPSRSPYASPMIKPRVQPPVRAVAFRPDITILNGEETERIKATAGGRLEWTLTENWFDIKSMPQNECITSPAFAVPRSNKMELKFYPNGSRTAEAGQCTVELSRGPDCAGVKFELILNGRSSGAKACISRRFHRDWARPFQMEEGSSPQQIVLGFHILEVFGGEGA